jgi:hypothetical protein
MRFAFLEIVLRSARLLLEAGGCRFLHLYYIGIVSKLLKSIFHHFHVFTELPHFHRRRKSEGEWNGGAQRSEAG